MKKGRIGAKRVATKSADKATRAPKKLTEGSGAVKKGGAAEAKKRDQKTVTKSKKVTAAATSPKAEQKSEELLEDATEATSGRVSTMDATSRSRASSNAES